MEQSKHNTSWACSICKDESLSLAFIQFSTGGRSNLIAMNDREYRFSNSLERSSWPQQWIAHKQLKVSIFNWRNELLVSIWARKRRKWLFPSVSLGFSGTIQWRGRKTSIIFLSGGVTKIVIASFHVRNYWNCKTEKHGELFLLSSLPLLFLIFFLAGHIIYSLEAMNI